MESLEAIELLKSPSRQCQIASLHESTQASLASLQGRGGGVCVLRAPESSAIPFPGGLNLSAFLFGLTLTVYINKIECGNLLRRLGHSAEDQTSHASVLAEDMGSAKVTETSPS
eukprot:NODE_5546_length_666_cov_17.753647_g5169_i0.p1 GENE.NODE_5546_length_666_cov_17.753647_g5169_i0~~NODE_5546_length_666_cov_17.753647_g5169_i0.p1  ORF type:complete len:114 (-),score=26.21 NODE_5546_length_666_cov_17.753647_g5169_i0:268-609(-)